MASHNRVVRVIGCLLVLSFYPTVALGVSETKTTRLRRRGWGHAVRSIVKVIPRDQEGSAPGVGTGFMQDGKVVTAFHNVDGADYVTIVLPRTQGPVTRTTLRTLLTGPAFRLRGNFPNAWMRHRWVSNKMQRMHPKGHSPSTLPRSRTSRCQKVGFSSSASTVLQNR